jgi:hypothetical protein
VVRGTVGKAVGDVLDRLREVVADGARGTLRVAHRTCGEDLAVLAVERFDGTPWAA